MAYALASESGIESIQRYDSGLGEAGSEVVSVEGSAIYVTNGAADRVDVFSTFTGAKLTELDLSVIPGFDGLNSVAAANGLVAVAMQRAAVAGEPQPGAIAIFGVVSGELLAVVDTGNLPDMVMFSEDGSQIYAAIEGEYSTDLSTQAAGGVAVIDITEQGYVHNFYGFSQYDGSEDALRDLGVRVFPGEAASVDFEPEYIAVDPQTGNLLVTLQEANTVAVFDIESRSFVDLIPLGTVDHSLAENALDASDKDDAINIRTYDNLVGLRMPDALAAVDIKGTTYFLTANEGDDRGDFDEGGDAARVKDILAGDVAGVSIDASVDTTGLERLNVSIIDGDTDDDGDIDILHSYGSRGFTIFDLDGNVVFNSGAQFERLIARYRPANAFNNDSYPSDTPDMIDENRSDNKGPEPEAIAVGEMGGRTFAFIGLERDSGIMIYDITDPANATFATYIECAAEGDLSPEVVKFIPATESGTGEAMLAVSFEVSGTTTLISLAGRIDGVVATAASAGSLLDDRMIGTSVNNAFMGGSGDDTLVGAEGNDTLDGGLGRDFLVGQDGNDRILGDDGRDTVWGGEGDDVLNGQNGHDRLMGGSENDRVFGGNGNDTLFGGDGNDTVAGGNGNDRALLGDGDDIWWDNAQSNGHDIVLGGAGDDLFHVGAGNDTMTGGTGVDTFVFADRIGDDVVTDYEVGVDALQVSAALWNGTLDQTRLDALTVTTTSGLVFTFDNGDILTLDGVSSTSGLLGDITLV